MIDSSVTIFAILAQVGNGVVGRLSFLMAEVTLVLAADTWELLQHSLLLLVALAALWGFVAGLVTGACLRFSSKTVAPRVHRFPETFTTVRLPSGVLIRTPA